MMPITYRYGASPKQATYDDESSMEAMNRMGSQIKFLEASGVELQRIGGLFVNLLNRESYRKTVIKWTGDHAAFIANNLTYDDFSDYRND